MIVAKDTCPRRLERYDATQNADGWHLRNDRLYCSYCGSLQPNMFISLMSVGVTLIPTDKNYKVYVQETNAERSKFYFQHLNTEDKVDFINLYNATPRTFTIDAPGYFYVKPFFVIMLEGVNDDGNNS